MRRLLCPCAVLVAAGLLAGCGGKKAAPATEPATTVAPPPATTTIQHHPPTVTSAADLAACAELQRNVRIVSQLVSNSTEAITQALHPDQLAKLTGNAQQSLLYSAKVIELVDAPTSLRVAKRQLVSGLRRFAADFGRARRSTTRGDIATAAQQLVDRAALSQITAATRKIDRTCGV